MLFKVGNIVKIKKEYAGYKAWYTTKSYTIIGFDADKPYICFLDSNLRNTDNSINSIYLELDTRAERKLKLKKLCLNQVIK